MGTVAKHLKNTFQSRIHWKEGHWPQNSVSSLPCNWWALGKYVNQTWKTWKGPERRKAPVLNGLVIRFVAKMTERVDEKEEGCNGSRWVLKQQHRTLKQTWIGGSTGRPSRTFPVETNRPQVVTFLRENKAEMSRMVSILRKVSLLSYSG